MRKNIIKLGGLALMLAVMYTSCENLQTAKQDSAEPIDPSDYPVATYTTDFSGSTVDEGDTLMYTITVDKMLDRAVTFQVTQMDGTGDDHDYTYEAAVLNPYTTEVSMMIVFPQEDIIEEDETLKLEVAPTALSDKYLINPSTNHPMLDLTVVNINQEGKLTINMDWNTEDDNDFGIWSADFGAWSYDGATSHKPEVDVTIWDTDPDGTFYVNVWDWGNPDFDYTFTFANPGGVIETITGSFSSATAAELYDEDLFFDVYPTYRVIEIVKSGSNYTISKL